MIRYISFFMRCFLGKISFFNLSLTQQAQILHKHKLYYLAGKYYFGLENYRQAAFCFKKCKANKHLIQAYLKLESPSKAIEIAQTHGYYELGAQICESIGNEVKAAYFFSFFNPLKAAKIYKRHNMFFQSGCCYLQGYHLNHAIECFNSCEQLSEKVQGLRKIEEIAITLYFQKSYELASKIFIKLGDYESAVICAQHSKKPELIKLFDLGSHTVEKLPT